MREGERLRMQSFVIWNQLADNLLVNDGQDLSGYTKLLEI